MIVTRHKHMKWLSPIVKLESRQTITFISSKKDAQSCMQAQVNRRALHLYILTEGMPGSDPKEHMIT